MRDTGDLKVWFREDILRILQGIEAASSSGLTDDQFREGFTMALVSVGLSVGLDPKAYLTHRNIELMRRRIEQLPGD